MRAWTILSCLLLTPVAAADAVLRAWANINLVDAPPCQVFSRDGSPVSSRAAGAGSSATASTSETSVSSRADSSDGNLMDQFQPSAFMNESFFVSDDSHPAADATLD